MGTIIFSILLFSVEFLIAFNYFKKIFEYKHNYKKSVIIVGLSYIVLIFIYILFSNTEWLNILFFTIVNYLSILLAFSSNQKNAIFHSLMLTLIMYLTEAITVFFISSIFNLSSTHYQDSFYLLIIDAVICKTLYFIFAKLISFIAVKESKKTNSGKYLILTLMPISSMGFTLLLHYLLTQSDVSENVAIISSVLSVIQLIANIIVFWIYENTQKNHQKILELQIANQKNILDLSYLKLLEEKNNSSDELIHDIKNHLLNINSIAESKEVSNYIKNVYGKVDKYSYIGKTSNKMLDLIINKYTTICKNKDIQLNIETFSENLSFINDVDLSTILNNLFDNSIEATENCDEKVIDFIVKRNDNGCRIIDLKNSCTQKPVIKNNKLLSTKKDSGYHGIGTKNIEKATKKYNGEIEWIYNEEQMTFQIIIIFP